MKRITWIDNFKYFCILAVMAEHAPCMTGLTEALNVSFYISGFFFASGYLYVHREGFSDFLKKKVRQLLIPWFFFSNFIVLSAFIFSFNEHEDLGQCLLNNLLQIHTQGDEMWFVAALFMAFIPFYFIISFYEKDGENKEKKEKWIILSGTVLSVLSYLLGETTVFGGQYHHYPWHLEYIFRGTYAMYFGYLFRRRVEVIFDRKNSAGLCAGLIAVLLLLVWGPQFSHHVFSAPDQTLHHYLTSFIGIPAVISLAKLIVQNRYMTFVGRNTISYYALHGKMESLLHVVFLKLFGEPYRALCWSFTDSVTLLLQATASSYLIALAVSVLLIPPVFLIDRYLPFLTGRPAVRAENHQPPTPST